MPEAAPTNLRDLLLDIRAKRGALTPAIVLDEARDPNHPLHDRFEWDDNVAAEKYRLSQAQGLLRVTYRKQIGDDVADLRAFWVSKGTDERPDSEYVPVEEIIMDPVAKQIMLNQMRRDWQSFLRRYKNMEGFADFILGQLTDGKETG